MTEERRADLRGRRRGDAGDWLERHSRALALIVGLQFVVLAALALGIAVTSDTAQHALAINERRAGETEALRLDVRKLTEQNAGLELQIAALRQQVESLGGVPVNVVVSDRRPAPSPAPPARPQPAPPPSTTTTTTTTAPQRPPCTVQVAGRCVTG